MYIQTEAYTSLFQDKSKYKAVMSALADVIYKEFNNLKNVKYSIKPIPSVKVAEDSVEYETEKK